MVRSDDPGRLAGRCPGLARGHARDAVRVQQRADGIGLVGAADSRRVDSASASRCHAAPVYPAGAVRFGPARHRRAAGAGCGRALSSQSARPPAGAKGSIRRIRTRCCVAGRRRTSRSVAWSSRSCRPRRAICIGFASIPGRSKANSRVWNPQRDKKENVSQLWQIHATEKERDGQVDQVSTGDIVGVIGPRHSITGDTLCDPQQPIHAALDRVRRNGPLDGDRAGERGGTQEAVGDAGNAQAAGSHVSARSRTKRRGRR